MTSRAFRTRRFAAFAACCLASAVALADNPIARNTMLAASGCASVNDLVVEYDAGPVDRPYLRVQHMGDPGTPDLAQQVANTVTWDVAAVTGLEAPAQFQRGYRDEQLPVGTSAVQLDCASAGFFINTWQFPHHSPLVGEGPNVQLSRDFGQPLAAFRDGASLVIEGTARVPFVRNQRAPVVTEGTAVAGFWYYAQDATTGTVIAHLLNVFDNRAPGVNGAGVELWGSDGIIAFVVSPIAAVDGAGKPVRFATLMDGSASMQWEAPFADARHFAVRISPDDFRAALELLHAGPLPGISTEPSDYRILSFGFGGEVIPGTGDEDNVALGASIDGLTLRELPLPRIGTLPRR